MNVTRIFISGLLALTGCLTTAWAQSDGSVGVPVKIWGVGNSLHQSSQPETAYMDVTGTALETYPGAANGQFDGHGETNTPNTYYPTDVCAVRLQPNKTYSVAVHANISYAYQELHVLAPPGYTTVIDGVQRDTFSVNLLSHTYTVSILQTIEADGRAGECTSLTGNQIRWQISLGSLQNGTGAGAISLIDPGTGSSWSTLFTPAALDCLPLSPEIQVYRDTSNNIRQIVANQAVVDVVTNSSTQYDIKFYNPGQRQGTAFPYTFTGLPYVTYRVEEGSTATTLQLTSYTRTLTSLTDTTAGVARTAVTTLQRSGSAPNFTWTLEDWNTSGSAQVTEQVVSSSGSISSTDTRTEALQVQTPSNTAVTSAGRTFTLYSWGEEPATQTLGSSNSLTTTLTYNDDSSNIGSQCFLQSVVAPGGSWEAYDYWNPAAPTYYSGTVKYRYRPYNNSPSTVTRDPTQGEVTYYEYALDAFFMPTRPSLVQTSINNVVTAKTVTTYATAAHSSSSTLIVVTATSQQYSDASNYLTTVTKYFQEDAGVATPSEMFYRSQPYSVTGPDQTKVSYSYEHGTFNETSHAFTSTSSGAASRIAVITGSANSSAGTSCTTYGSFDIDDLYLVDGKSTCVVTIRDALALVRRTETYAWKSSAWNLVSYTDFTYDYAGQLLSRVASNGATYTAVYDGEQKTSETGETGVIISYGYDAAGRVSTAIKSSGPTSTFTYDASDRRLSETVSASSTGETLYSANVYDDAGRLTSETPAGLSAITYTYNVSGRSRTAAFDDGGTRTDYYQLSGQLDHVDGSAVVPQYNTYTIESDGRRTLQVNSGASSSARWQKGTTDWLGRALHSEHPGFSVSSQANYSEDNTYETGTGHLIQTTRSGLAPTLYQYDALGSVLRSGVAISNGTSLVLASTDRIGESEQFFETDGTDWWLRQETRTYPKLSDATLVTTSVSRKRLTGFPSNRLDETQVIDVEGNTVTRTVDVNRSTATVTITTTRPSVANTQVETIVNGLTTSVVGHDGLTTTAQYDALERPSQNTDSRGNTRTTTYKYGSTLVQSVTDGANNSQGTISYDGMGRRQWVQDALGQYTRFTYNQRGQLTNQWGGGSYPVSYGYDSTYGDRTTLNTYRGAPSGDSGSWPSVGTADTTTWTYDGATGLLWKKTDAASQVTEFDYNVRGQTSSRKWARHLVSNTSLNLITTYGYDGNTGELTGVTYNDSGEVIPTPSLTYTYTRLGQIATAADGTGSRTFNYNSSAPWRMDSETLDSSFYASRVITRNYDTASGTGGSYGPYTPGFFKGRYTGYDLGVAGNTARDQHIGYTTSNLGRFVGVNACVTTGSARDYVYSYVSSSALVGGYTMGSFSVSRFYETQRDLLTTIDSQWSGSSVTHYDYSYNTMAQRQTAKQSGSAFADYYTGMGYSSVYNVYNYNARGELETTAMYRGNTATTTPSSGDELPGHRFEYRFDSIGNRTTAGETGSSSSADDVFNTNALNQYTDRENNSVRVLGTAKDTAHVAVDGAASTGKNDRVWGADIVPANGSGPAQGNAAVYAALIGGGSGGADLVRTATMGYFVPAAAQTFTYDADGNLTSDGAWTYTYNAENQLVRMASTLPTGFTGMHLRLDFKYDYAGRRVEKRVYDNDLAAQTSARRYLCKSRPGCLVVTRHTMR